MVVNLKAEKKYDVQRKPVYTDPIESFQDISGGQIQFIQDDPVTFPHGFYQNS